LEESRKEAAEEKRLRAEAEARIPDAARESEDRRIQDKVTAWVRSGRIDPAEAHATLKHCRDLSAADSRMGFSGADSLLGRHEAMIDGRKETGVCQEQVPGSTDPARGGIIVAAPASPDDASAQEIAVREARQKQLDALAQWIQGQVGLAPSANGTN
jgi:hypothetical protein